MAFEWKSDIDAKDPQLDEDNLAFIFEEAKIRLRATVASYDVLSGKTNNLLMFVVGITAAIGAIVAGNLSNPMTLIPLAAYLACTVATVCYAFHALWARQIDVEGYCPELLFQKKFMEQQPKELKARILKRYGEKIAWNIEVTDRIGSSLRKATIWYAVGCGLLAWGVLATTSLLLVWRWIVIVCE